MHYWLHHWFILQTGPKTLRTDTNCVKTLQRSDSKDDGGVDSVHLGAPRVIYSILTDSRSSRTCFSSDYSEKVTTAVCPLWKSLLLEGPNCFLSLQVKLNCSSKALKFWGDQWNLERRACRETSLWEERGFVQRRANSRTHVCVYALLCVTTAHVPPTDRHPATQKTFCSPNRRTEANYTRRQQTCEERAHAKRSSFTSQELWDNKTSFTLIINY